MSEVDALLAENRRLSAAIEQRTGELAVVNAVQQALAAELDMQHIYEAVGDKIREIFHDADLDIRILDPDTGLVEFPYLYDKGERLRLEPTPVSGVFAHVAASGRTLVVNENYLEAISQLGAERLAGTSSGEKSGVWIPLTWADRVIGLISVTDYQREHAFSESDVRLLETLAGVLELRTAERPTVR